MSTTPLTAVLTLLLLAASGAVHAQPAAKGYVIGILTPTFDEVGLSCRLPGWLEELGYREGKNVRYEHASPSKGTTACLTSRRSWLGSRWT